MTNCRYNFNMDKYNSIEELANNTADYLSMGMIVYCDPENLTAAGIFENWLFEYSEYLELDDKEFEEIRKGDDRWQIDHAQFLREAVSLPVTIESPESRTVYRWMEDFIDEHQHQRAFFEKATKALERRKPFKGFKYVVFDFNLQQEWFAYRSRHLADYVLSELSYRNSSPEMDDDDDFDDDFDD